VRTVLPSSDDGAHEYTFWIFRLLLYAAFLIAMRYHAIRLDSWLTVVLAGSCVLTAVTVVLYSGDVRYMYPINILLLTVLCAASYRRSSLNLPEGDPEVEVRREGGRLSIDAPNSSEVR
jgi:hypothetical protein